MTLPENVLPTTLQYFYKIILDTKNLQLCLTCAQLPPPNPPKKTINFSLHRNKLELIPAQVQFISTGCCQGTGF